MPEMLRSSQIPQKKKVRQGTENVGKYERKCWDVRKRKRKNAVIGKTSQKRKDDAGKGKTTQEKERLPREVRNVTDSAAALLPTNILG